MSLRYLYRKYGASRRICEGCGRVIHRNIAVHRGELWHYGCLMEAKKKRWRCLGCGAALSKLETSETTILGETERSCGYCGSTALAPLHTWPREITIVGDLHSRRP